MPNEIPNRYIIRGTGGEPLSVTKEGEEWAKAHGVPIPAAPQGKSKRASKDE